MTHRKNSERARAEREALALGKAALEAIRLGDGERAGALALFAIRWAKRSLGGKR